MLQSPMQLKLYLVHGSHPCADAARSLFADTAGEMPAGALAS
jgi:hypothetical protein